MDVLVHKSMVQLQGRSDVRILVVYNSSRHFRHRAHHRAVLVFEMIVVVFIIHVVLVIVGVVFNRHLLHLDDLLFLRVAVVADHIRSIIVHFI